MCNKLAVFERAASSASEEQLTAQALVKEELFGQLNEAVRFLRTECASARHAALDADEKLATALAREAELVRTLSDKQARLLTAYLPLSEIT